MSARKVSHQNKEYNELLSRMQRYFGRHFNLLLVNLHDKHGWTFQDIAVVIGSTKQNVHTMYHRLKKEQGGK